MITEINEIQQAFMDHYGVKMPSDLKVRDGFYLVHAKSQDYRIQIEGGKLYILLFEHIGYKCVPVVQKGEE